MVALSGALSGLAGVTALLTARWMGAADRGVFAIAMAVSGGVLLVASLGTVNTATVLIPDRRRGLTVRGYLRKATILALLVSVIVIPIASLTLSKLTGSKATDLLAVFSVYCCLALLAALYRAGLHGWERHRSAVVGDLLAAAVVLVGAALLMSQDVLTVTSLLAVGAVGFAVQSFMSAGLVLLGTTRERRPGMSLATLARFSMPTLGFTFGGWLMAKGDRIVLGAVGTPSDVGVYSTAATLAEIPWLVAAALATVLIPRVAGGESLQLVTRYRLAAISGTLGAGILLLPVSWWLLNSFLGGEFVGGTASLFILLPSAVVRASTQIDLAACLAVRDTHSGSRISLVGAALVPVLVTFLAVPFGTTGCALASLATNLVVALLSRLAWRKNLQRLGQSRERSGSHYAVGGN